jgi:hypothetical protein
MLPGLQDWDQARDQCQVHSYSTGATVNQLAGGPVRDECQVHTCSIGTAVSQPAGLVTSTLGLKRSPKWYQVYGLFTAVFLLYSS